MSDDDLRGDTGTRRFFIPSSYDRVVFTAMDDPDLSRDYTRLHELSGTFRWWLADRLESLAHALRYGRP